MFHVTSSIFLFISIHSHSPYIFWSQIPMLMFLFPLDSCLCFGFVHVPSPSSRLLQIPFVCDHYIVASWFQICTTSHFTLLCLSSLSHSVSLHLFILIHFHSFPFILSFVPIPCTFSGHRLLCSCSHSLQTLVLCFGLCPCHVP